MNDLITAAQNILVSALAWTAGTAGLATALLAAVAAVINGRKTR
ncbi:hypothetical protein [Streptomyces fractus]